MPPTALAAKSPRPVSIACDHEQEADVPERNGNDGPALQHDGSRFVGPSPTIAFYRMTQRARISLPRAGVAVSGREEGARVTGTSPRRRQGEKPAFAGVCRLVRIRLRSRLLRRQHAAFERQLEPFPY